MQKWILALLLLFLSISSFAANKAVVLSINGIIGPATQDYITRHIKDAEKDKAQFIILKINTPGGLETSMNGINQVILDSSIPVISYVAPAGASAGSAGTYILYASHFSAMAPGTHVGAATPVALPEHSQDPLSNGDQKMVNDAVGYIKSLARLHNRNEEWAESAVRQAASIPAEDAKRLKVINELADSQDDLLKKLHGKQIKLKNKMVTLNTDNIQIQQIDSDWRYEFLSFLTHPNLVYLLLLIAIYGLFFEFSNPGLILPGVVGSISLILVLYAFQLLPVNYVGLTLILVGLTFMAIEVYVTNYGILGLGGILAFILGSIMLFDSHDPNYHLTLWFIFVMSVLSFLFFFMLLQLAIKSQQKEVVTGREGLIGKEGIIISIIDEKIVVRVLGEIWEAKSSHPLVMGQRVIVQNVRGLTLIVTPAKQI